MLTPLAGERSVEEHIHLLHTLVGFQPVDYANETIQKDFFGASAYNSGELMSLMGSSRYTDHVDRAIVPRVPAEQHPPASVLVYAARNIMKPQLVVSQIPDLLTLLGHLNVLRKFAVTKASHALAWHKQFRDNPTDDVSLLSPDIQARLERARDRAHHYQQVYRHVVNTCYEVVCFLLVSWQAVPQKLTRTQQDIYHTFLHGSPKMFWSKMQTYFPGQFTDESDDEASAAAAQARMTRLYHHDLSEDELRDSRNTGLRCAKFAHDVARYMEDPAAFCAEVGCGFAKGAVVIHC